MRTALKAISTAALLGALATAAPASAATVLSAGWTEGCGKTTCFGANGSFSKTWSAADAAGPITVGQLKLDRNVLGALDSKTFRIAFRLNGQELGTWGNFTMGGIAGDELFFRGANFTWNPEDGDLELVLELTPPPEPGVGGFRFSALGNEGPQDLPPGSTTQQPGGQEPGRGPLPGPIPGAGAVPEPSTWALMIGGFGLAGAALRSRRTPRLVPVRIASRIRD